MNELGRSAAIKTELATMIQAMARDNFTDIQKAQIYANDLATCAFSGKNLWLLDGGVAGTYMIDWADHIMPLSKGGTSTLENGVCSSWLYNYNKGTNVGANIYLYNAGLPTPHYFWCMT